VLGYKHYTLRVGCHVTWLFHVEVQKTCNAALTVNALKLGEWLLPKRYGHVSANVGFSRAVELHNQLLIGATICYPDSRYVEELMWAADKQRIRTTAQSFENKVQTCNVCSGSQNSQALIHSPRPRNLPLRINVSAFVVTKHHCHTLLAHLETDRRPLYVPVWMFQTSLGDLEQ